MPTTNEQILVDISTDIDQTIPDRPNAAAPTYKSFVIRALLKRIIGKMTGYSPTTIVVGNGDGVTIPTATEPGYGMVRFIGNLIVGISEFAMVNYNLAADGFSFSQMIADKKRVLLMAVRKNGVAIGTDNPEEKLHVVGRIKSYGLVATGPTPTASVIGTGLGTGGTIAMASGATDQAGVFTIVTGSNPVAGQMARISFANKVARTPVAVLISASSTSAGPHLGKVVLYGESSSALVLTGSDGGALPANTSFSFYYQVIV